MESTFNIKKTHCHSCKNLALKTLGMLQGVYGADIDTINGIVSVLHTDEVSRDKIANELLLLGYVELSEDVQSTEPSEWGCAL